MKYYVIPTLKDLDKYLDLAKKFNLGFEYNEFFMPNILDDYELLNKTLESYKSLNRINDTMHGVFFDIVLDSRDEKIRKISEDRVEESIKIAKSLNCKGVVFHTNYITWMKDEAYKARWVKMNGDFYLSMVNKYSDIEIYVENMFDLDPILLRRLMEYTNNPRIKVCLDIAHASISKVEIKDWFKELGKYIGHLHINDNDKIIDMHEELGKGLIDYKKAYKYINMLDDNTSILIEISNFDKVYNSIKYLKDGGYSDFK
ncbi:MAG: sugar phosphate isomerase/epimerase [Acholeplasmatales bacterium]|nr:sugar phosphate isomerase/epimerase [Acholeplasmatales bacterium]